MLAKPLTQLLKKENQTKFVWTQAAQDALVKLNQVSSLVLATPNFSIPFVLECDATETGIGAVLMQERQPVTYFNRALSAKTLSKFAYEREMMALVLAIQHWHPYLLGNKFLVHTDHHSLKHLVDSSTILGCQNFGL